MRRVFELRPVHLSHWNLPMHHGVMKNEMEERANRSFENRGLPNKKGGEVSTFFAPNLTMNLTYLCYGTSKIGGRGSNEAKKPMKAQYYR